MTETSYDDNLLHFNWGGERVCGIPLQKNPCGCKWYFSEKRNHLRYFFFLSILLRVPPLSCFTPVIASSHHVFTSFSLVLQWHLCLTHSDTYVVLLWLPSRAFGWGPLFVVDRIAVINVPSPDPSCSLLPQPSLLGPCCSWCLNLPPQRQPPLSVCAPMCMGGSNDVWELRGFLFRLLNYQLIASYNFIVFPLFYGEKL